MLGQNRQLPIIALKAFGVLVIAPSRQLLYQGPAVSTGPTMSSGFSFGGSTSSQGSGSITSGSTPFGWLNAPSTGFGTSAPSTGFGTSAPSTGFGTSAPSTGFGLSSGGLSGAFASGLGFGNLGSAPGAFGSSNQGFGFLGASGSSSGLGAGAAQLPSQDWPGSARIREIQQLYAPSVDPSGRYLPSDTVAGAAPNKSCEFQTVMYRFKNGASDQVQKPQGVSLLKWDQVRQPKWFSIRYHDMLLRWSEITPTQSFWYP